MKSSQISAKNICGRTFTHQLEAVNLIVGDNMAGKSAITNAIRIALKQKPPGLGERDITKLATGTDMLFSLQFDDNTEARSSFVLNRGRWSATQICSLEVPPVLLNIEEFFSMTSAGRTNYVFDQIDLAKIGFDDESVICAIKNTKLEKSTPATERIVQSLCTKAHEDALVFAPQEWINDLIEHTKQLVSDKKAAVKQMEQNLTGQAQLQAQDSDEVIPENIETLLTQARERLDAVRIVADRLEQKRKEAERKQSRREEIQKAILALPVLSTENFDEKIDALQKRIAEQPADDFELRNRAASLSTDLRASAASAISKDAEIMRAKDRHTKELSGERCPFCGSRSKSWKESLIERQAEELAVLSATLKALTSECDRLRPLVVEATEKLATLDESQKQSIVMRGELRSLMNKARDSKSTRDQLTKLNAELEVIGIIEPPALEEIARVNSDVLRAMDDVKSLTEKQNKAIAQRQDDRRREEAKALLETTREESSTVKAVLDSLITFQEELNAKAIGSITKIARLFTDEIMKGPLDFRDGDLGYFAAEQWVSYKTFSGTERMLAFAGFSVALCQQSPYKLVIIDELGVMTEANQQKLIGKMVALTANGTIDQFIGIIAADTQNALSIEWMALLFDVNVIEVKAEPRN